jgi:Lon protease-like protein
VRAEFGAFEADLSPAPEPVTFDRPAFFDALRLYLERRGLDVDWETAESAPPEALINSLAMALPFEAAEKQALLEAPDLENRAGALTTLMRIDAAEPGDGETRLQ